jgi:hypothetical protein
MDRSSAAKTSGWEPTLGAGATLIPQRQKSSNATAADPTRDFFIGHPVVQAALSSLIAHAAGIYQSI